MVTIFIDKDIKITFYNNNKINFGDIGSEHSKLYQLMSKSKVIVLWKNNVRVNRIVNDNVGRTMSVGYYNEVGSKYIKEEFYNIYMQKVFESISPQGSRDRWFCLYLYGGKIFKGNNAEQEMTHYLWEKVLDVKNGDIIVVDEPKFYPLLLELGDQSNKRVAYFHWPNLGKNEDNLMSDKVYHKDLVFLTDKQKIDFLKRTNNQENKTINSHVVDNVLEENDQLVSRSDDNLKRIMFIGRLSPEKNVSLVINAFSEYYKRDNNVRLLIIGNGSDKETLEELVNKLNLNEVVNFVGNLLFPYTTDYFNNVDLAVLTPKIESYGLVYPELISRGIPVVTVDAPYGPSKWIKDDINGYLLPLHANKYNISEYMEHVINLSLSPKYVSNSLDIKKMNEKLKVKMDYLFGS